MKYDEETDSLIPCVVSDPPKTIWLVVGDIEQDCAFRELDEVSWCDDEQFPSDVKYILHSDHEAAIKAAVAKRDDEWASAIAKFTPYAICKKIADEMSKP